MKIASLTRIHAPEATQLDTYKLLNVSGSLENNSTTPSIK